MDKTGQQQQKERDQQPAWNDPFLTFSSAPGKGASEREQEALIERLLKLLDVDVLAVLQLAYALVPAPKQKEEAGHVHHKNP